MGTKLTFASLLINNKAVGLVLLSKVCRWGFLHYLPGSVRKREVILVAWLISCGKEQNTMQKAQTLRKGTVEL